jgi:hypothetical protein
MSLMAASSCCCGVECTCPVETDIPTSVLVTVTVTGCAGTAAVLSCVAQVNTEAPCVIQAGCLCGKYTFETSTTTPGGCLPGNFLCDPVYEEFDYGTTAGYGRIGISSLAIGTNGTGQNAEPYTLCDLWVIRIKLSLYLWNPGIEYVYQTQGPCLDCGVSQASAPCVFAQMPTEIVFCKPSGQSPTGGYASCDGGPLEFCGINPPSCETFASAYVVDDITVA